MTLTALLLVTQERRGAGCLGLERFLGAYKAANSCGSGNKLLEDSQFPGGLSVEGRLLHVGEPCKFGRLGLSLAFDFGRACAETNVREDRGAVGSYPSRDANTSATVRCRSWPASLRFGGSPGSCDDRQGECLQFDSQIPGCEIAGIELGSSRLLLTPTFVARKEGGNAGRLAVRRTFSETGRQDGSQRKTPVR